MVTPLKYFNENWSDEKLEAALKELDNFQTSSSKKEKSPKASSSQTYSKTQSEASSSGFPKGVGTFARSFTPKTSEPLSGQAGLLHKLAEVYDSDNATSSEGAVSEKDKGNKFFKAGKYEEAISCYSLSIGMEPTAVAFANRAMAEIKLKRFEEAESDCTHAMDLDGSYVKAFTRRGTARLNLKKLDEAKEDFLEALKLEPGSKEIQKQLQEVEIEIQNKRKSNPVKATKAVEEIKEIPSAPEPQPKKEASKKLPKTESPAIKSQPSSAPPKEDLPIEEKNNEIIEKVPEKSKAEVSEKLPALTEVRTTRFAENKLTKPESSSKNGGVKKDEDIKRQFKGESPEIPNFTSAVVKRASEEARVQILRDSNPPKSFFEFEALWKGVGEDRKARAQILRKITPVSVPSIFKNSMTHKFLKEMLLSLWEFSDTEVKLVVEFLDSFTKVPRFSLVVMFFSKKDKEDVVEFFDSLKKKGPLSQEELDQIEELEGIFAFGSLKK